MPVVDHLEYQRLYVVLNMYFDQLTEGETRTVGPLTVAKRESALEGRLSTRPRTVFREENLFDLCNALCAKNTRREHDAMLDGIMFAGRATGQPDERSTAP